MSKASVFPNTSKRIVLSCWGFSACLMIGASRIDIFLETGITSCDLLYSSNDSRCIETHYQLSSQYVHIPK